mgnify:CR=1 FL=1|tara:strand:+ start:31 stop:345 length:315 start_codon:yes stop_codon:yes gene_type:complete
MSKLSTQDASSTLMHNRLERMEDKIDKLVEITGQLSRIEEISSNQREQIARLVIRVDQQEDFVRELLELHAQTTGSKKAFQWIVATVVAFAGIVVGWFGTNPVG